jgi:5'-3' exonuclease
MSDIVLIDLSSILHQVWHVSTDDPNPNATSIGVVKRVRELASATPHAAVCIDSPPYLRSQIDPLYKANRKAEDRAPLYHQQALAIDTLKADGFPILGAKGYEADDVIGTAVKQILASSTQRDGAIVICTADKDLSQLVTDLYRVQIKSVRDGSVLDEAAVREKFGVDPAQIVDWLSMVGDKSDNVPGIPGVGPVGATNIIKKYGSLDKLYEAIDGGATFDLAPAQRTKLVDFRAQYPTTKALITLRTDAPIEIADILKPRTPQPSADSVTFGDDSDDWGDTPSIGGSAGGSMAAAADAGVSGEITPAGSVGDSRQHFRREPNGDIVRTDTGEVVPQSFVDDINEAFGGATIPINPPIMHKPAFADAVAGATTEACPAVHDTGADCELPRGHKQNHRGVFQHGTVQWPDRDAASQEKSTHGTGTSDRREEAPQAQIAPPAQAEVRPADSPVAVGPVVRRDQEQGEARHQSDHAAGAELPRGAGEIRRDGSGKGDPWRQVGGQSNVGTALVARGTGALTGTVVDYERQLEPRNIQEAQQIAKWMFESRMFNGYGNPQAAMASLRQIHNIESKHALSAQLMVGLCLRSGKADYFEPVEVSDTKVTYETQRKGREPIRASYTIEQAVKAGLVKKGSNWEKDPESQLIARASSRLARRVYPDIVGGLYTPEELRAMQAGEGEE